MKLSPYRAKRKKELEKRAVILYKRGLTLREVGKVLSRSHTWAWRVINSLPLTRGDREL